MGDGRLCFMAALTSIGRMQWSAGSRCAGRYMPSASVNYMSNVNAHMVVQCSLCCSWISSVTCSCIPGILGQSWLIRQFTFFFYSFCAFFVSKAADGEEATSAGGIFFFCTWFNTITLHLFFCFWLWVCGLKNAEIEDLKCWPESFLLFICYNLE